MKNKNVRKGHFSETKPKRKLLLPILILFVLSIAVGIFCFWKRDARQEPAADQSFPAPTDARLPESLAVYANAIAEFENRGSGAAPISYVFYDFDGDGQQELLLGSGEAVRWVLKETDGQVRTIWEADAESNVYLCENGILWEESARGNWFTDWNGTVVEFVYYAEETGSWYRKNKEKTPDVPIEEETAMEILNSFVRVQLDWKPLADTP